MTREDVVGQFSIGESEQARFARLSGDWNPIHVDQEFARRSSFGEIVAHGINTLLTGLEQFADSLNSDDQTGVLACMPASISVQFPRPVFVGDALRLVRLSQDAARLRLVVRSGDVDLAKITIGLRQETHSLAVVPGPDFADLNRLPAYARRAPLRRAPADRSMADGERLSFALPFSVDANEFAASYPALIRWFGECRVASIALLSSVVGMEWPGARSLFTEAKIQLLDVVEPEAKTLETRVLSADPKHGLTSAETVCPGLRAVTSAFFRPSAVMQPRLQALKTRVAHDAFAGWTTLVVGGSRGLGEVAAKLMAAGGADVVVTYRSGREQADAVQAEIAGAGGRCAVMAFDAVQSKIALPALARTDAPVLLFYSASPHIFRRRTQGYSRAWLDEFLTIYVDGFVGVLQAVKAWTRGPIAILYPSSEAVDQPMAQLIEYAAAKAAGEAACRSLTAGDARIRLELPRLPRLLTDQTNSIIHVDTAETVDVLLPVLTRLTKNS